MQKKPTKKSFFWSTNTDKKMTPQPAIMTVISRMAAKDLKQGDIYRHTVNGEFYEVVVTKDKMLLEIRRGKVTFTKKIKEQIQQRMWPTLAAWMEDMRSPTRRAGVEKPLAAVEKPIATEQKPIATEQEIKPGKVLHIGENEERSSVVVLRNKTLLELRRGDITFSEGIGCVGNQKMTAEEWSGHKQQRRWGSVEEWQSEVKRTRKEPPSTPAQPVTQAVPEAPKKAAREENMFESGETRLTLCFADKDYTPIVELKNKWLEGARQQIKESFEKELVPSVLEWIKKMNID